MAGQTGMAEAGKRTRAVVVRAERLSKRNQKQGELLQDAAGRMADKATAYAESMRAQAQAGDPGALALYRRAVMGRARARRLAAT